MKEGGKKERGITVDGCCLDVLVGTIFSDKDWRAAGMDGKGRHIPPGNRISLMAAGAVQRPPCLMLVIMFSEMLLSESQCDPLYDSIIFSLLLSYQGTFLQTSLDVPEVFLAHALRLVSHD